MTELIIESFVDCLKIFPFLFIAYLLIEIIEGLNGEKLKKSLRGKGAPVFAGLMGAVPQCGFSVMSSRLYSAGAITVGTLLSVFISTSDEGLIVLLTNGKVKDALLIVAIKIIYAIIVGLVVNAFIKKPIKVKEVEIKNENCPHCKNKHSTKKMDKFFWHPLLHAFKIFIFILIINVIFALLVYYIGEERLFNFLNTNVYLQPLLAVLVGLLPNCSASVVLAETYCLGALSFGGLIAGLSANAGVGIAVLFKDKHNLNKNLLILLALSVLSLILGYSCLIVL